ncbi:MAG TPA: GNAT family N-acetyltransferase [Solirubrobacterales bacterium]
MTARAELLDDGGAASSSGEHFFRSPQFLEAEGVTHTLRIEAGEEELVAPLIVRPIGAGPEIDATSPYGYPGLARVRDSDRDASEVHSALDAEAIDFSETALVSVFLRHTLEDPPPLAGARGRNVVQIADPALPPKSRMSDRQQIRKNLKRGYELRIVPGPDASAEERAAFLEAYVQTMRRTGAAERYFFGAGYFDRLLAAPSAWLTLAVAPDGVVAAASIAARSDGFLHYYLSGSVDSHLRDSPMKNVVAALVELAGDLGLPLNLGGGIVPGDRLEEFKRGFANREETWRSSELVCDPEAYARLSQGIESGEYFPAYRAV